MATEVDKVDRMETLQQAFYEYQTVTNKTLLGLGEKIKKLEKAIDLLKNNS